MTPTLGSTWKFLVCVCIPSFLIVNHNYLSQSPLSTLISCNPKGQSWKGFVNHRGKRKALWYRADCWLTHHYDSPGSRLLLCISLFHIRGYTLFIYDFICYYGTESRGSISMLVCFKTLRTLKALCAWRPPWSELFCMRWPHDTADGNMSQPRCTWGIRHWWVHNICTASVHVKLNWVSNKTSFTLTQAQGLE